MIDLTGRIVGSEAVQQTLLGITPQAQQRVRDEVKRQGLEVLRLAKAKVSDDLLRVRTGRLRRSINEKSEDDGSTFTSTTGTNLVYARPHEMGCHDTVQVREYLRRTKAQMLRRAGKTSKDRIIKHGKFAGEVIPGRFNETGPKEMGMTTVRAHSMKMNIPEKSFLRSSLAERKNEIRAGLVKAVGGFGR